MPILSLFYDIVILNQFRRVRTAHHLRISEYSAASERRAMRTLQGSAADLSDRLIVPAWHIAADRRREFIPLPTALRA